MTDVYALMIDTGNTAEGRPYLPNDDIFDIFISTYTMPIGVFTSLQLAQDVPYRFRDLHVNLRSPEHNHEWREDADWLWSCDHPTIECGLTIRRFELDGIYMAH